MENINSLHIITNNIKVVQKKKNVCILLNTLKIK